MTEPLPTIISRIEQAMVKAVTDVPCGMAQVSVSDLRRLIEEVRKRK